MTGAPQTTQPAAPVSVYPSFATGLENMADRLLALASMVSLLVEESSEKPLATGIFHLFHREAVELTALCDEAVKFIDERQDYVDPTKEEVRSMLAFRLNEIIAAIRKEGKSLPDENRKDARLALLYADKVQEKMRYPSDPLEAGSFLPWAEAEIRREITGTVTAPPFLDPELFAAVAGMARSAMRERDPALPETETEWPEDLLHSMLEIVGRHYSEILEKLGDEKSRLIAGSLLPWAELRIRREILDAEWDTPDSVVSRTVDRLTGEQQESRKAG